MPVIPSGLIPSARIPYGQWQPGVYCGVIGGIPTNRTNLLDVTSAPYNADLSGDTDASAAIQAAIDAVGSYDGIYIPAGTPRIDNTLVAGSAFNGKSIVGAGEGLTTLQINTNVGLTIGGASGFSALSPAVTVTAGIFKGSATVTLTDATYFPVGKLMMLLIENDDSVPVVSTFSFARIAKQLVRVTARSGNDVTFFPPLYDDYGSGSLEIRAEPATTQAEGIGLESLTIDCTLYSGGSGGSQAGVNMSQCYGSWIKNVRVRKAYNYTAIMGDCLNCEMRHSYIGELKGGGTNGAALLFSSHATLIVDNIGVSAFPVFEMNGGAAGNVIAYNYGGDLGMWDTNHAPHNRFNLIEGCDLSHVMSDGYFGSEEYLTLYRTRCRTISISLRRFSRSASAVGCLLSNSINCGLPNIGNGDSLGTAQPSADDFWRDWNMTAELTTRTDDNSGVLTLNSGALFATQLCRLIWGDEQARYASVSAVDGDEVTIVNYAGGTALPAQGTTLSIGPGSHFTGSAATGSFQEIDLDVEATLWKLGNVYTDTETSDSMGGETLIPSLIYDEKPDWWPVEMDWPPYDPTDAATRDIERIPAGYRFVHGDNPAPSGGDITATTLNVSTLVVG